MRHIKTSKQSFKRKLKGMTDKKRFLNKTEHYENDILYKRKVHRKEAQLLKTKNDFNLKSKIF